MNGLIERRNGLFHLLSRLDENEIPYVSWKNNHELACVVAGERDLDLFVPIDHAAEFISICNECSWLEVINSVASFPWVHHFYGLDDNFVFHHVHVYFKVITGESWLKEYLLPLDQWLIDNRTRSPEYGIWTLNNTAQAYLFVIRHLMKGSSFSSRLLYSRELISYRQEWLRCEQEPSDLARAGPIEISPYLPGALIQRDDLHLPRLLTAIQFRMSIAPFLRVQWWSLFARRATSFLARFINKFFIGRKKTLTNGGLVIAVSGVDGAGKSTMLNEAGKVFGAFLTVDRFHMGRPQGAMVELIRRAISKSNSSQDNALPNSVSPVRSVKKAFSAMFLALLRLRLARIVVRRAARGNLVLVDRWPTDKVGKMDGPRIGADIQSSLIIRFFGRVESWAYSCMPKVNICYFFELPVNVAIERNRARIKEGKESDDEITARFDCNRDFQPLARKVIRFDNSGEFAVKRREFLSSVWNNIVAR